MDTDNVTLPVPKPKVKKPATEIQKANMQKGWEALKLRREAMAKAKEEGTEPPAPKEKVPIPKQIARQRNPSNISKVREELEQLKSMVRENSKPAVEIVREVPVDRVVEKIVDREVPVERVVEREKVLSGSALLDRLFFNR